MSAYKEWLDANVDSLSESWSVHLSEMSMTQALDHVTRLANSDAAFEEYCYTQYEDAQGCGPEPDDCGGV